MKPLLKLLLLSVLLPGGMLPCHALAPPEDSTLYRDFEYLYDIKSVINCRLSGIKTPEGYNIYAELSVTDSKRDIAQFFSENRFRFFASCYTDYLSRDILYFDSLPAQNTHADRRARTMRFNYRIPAFAGPDAITFLAVYDTENELINTYDLPLKTAGRELLQPFATVTPGDSFPLPHLQVGEAVGLSPLAGHSHYYVYGYAGVFDHAQGFLTRAAVWPKLSYDTFFVLPTHEAFIPARQGFYLIQYDTASLTEGLSIFASHARYPVPARIQDLTGPMRYITKQEEYNYIATATETKEAFERLWLQFAGNPNDARKLMKEYYDRVALANRIFTEYKEGYKTDRGMVLTVIGKPDIVIKTHEKEIWTYKLKNKETVEWVFMKTSTLTAPNKYTLLRTEKHLSLWNKSTEAWRNGKISFSK